MHLFQTLPAALLTEVTWCGELGQRDGAHFHHPGSRRSSHLSRQRWSTSDGCHSAWGKARAKCATCWPEPEATSSTRTPRWAGSTYCCSTRKMGSLFRSAAAATNIATAKLVLKR